MHIHTAETAAQLLSFVCLASAAVAGANGSTPRLQRRLERYLNRGKLLKAIRLFRTICNARMEDAQALLPTLLFGICRAAVSDRNPNVRSLGTSALGHLGMPEAVPMLRELLRDEVPIVRICAEEALSQFKDASLIEDLAHQLQGYDHYVKTRAAWAVGKISFKPSAVTPYKGRLGSETQILARPQLSVSGQSDASLEDIRKPFVEHIFYSEIEATRIADISPDAGEVPPDKRVYYLLTRGLAGEGTFDERVYELKGTQLAIGRRDCDILFRDQATSQRHAILSISDRIFTIEDNGSRNGVYVNGQRITEPQILKENDLIRIGENDLLVVAVRRDCSIILLLQEALHDEDPYFRNSATWALGEIGGQLATSTVSVALRDPSNIVRKNAAEALGKIGSFSSVPALEQILQEDPDRFVRKNAAEALGKIGDPSCAPVLELALQQDVDRFVRKNAAEALGKIGDPSCVPALELALLSDDSQFAQEAVLQALGRLKCPGSHRHIKAFLDSSSISVKVAAVEAIAQIQSDEARNLLARILEDDDIHTKISASRHQIEHGELRFAALQKALEDPDSFVRLRAVEVLPEVAHPQESELLQNALHDPIIGVRIKAVQALSRTTGGAPVCHWLLHALEDEHPEVRLHAVIDLCQRMRSDSQFLSSLQNQN